MGDTLIIQGSLIMLTLASFFIYFVLMKYNKKLAGGAIVFLGIAMSTLGTSVSDLANMSAIISLIIIFVGAMVFFDGLVNKE